MMRSKWFIGLLALTASHVVAAATVFVQYPDPGGPGITFHPTFATQIGPGFFAEADMLGGVFKAKSESPDASFAYSGFRELTLTNPVGNAPILLPSGALGANVTAQYTLGPPAPTGSSSAAANISSTLAVNDGSLARVARGDHSVGIHWQDGAIFVSPTNTTIPNTLNGGTVLFNTATLTSLDMTLLMPAMTIDPGETLEIRLLLQTTTGANGPGVNHWPMHRTARRFFSICQRASV